MTWVLEMIDANTFIEKWIELGKLLPDLVCNQSDLRKHILLIHDPPAHQKVEWPAKWRSLCQNFTNTPCFGGGRQTVGLGASACKVCAIILRPTLASFVMGVYITFSHHNKEIPTHLCNGEFPSCECPKHFNIYSHPQATKFLIKVYVKVHIFSFPFT